MLDIVNLLAVDEESGGVSVAAGGRAAAVARHVGLVTRSVVGRRGARAVAWRRWWERRGRQVLRAHGRDRGREARVGGALFWVCNEDVAGAGDSVSRVRAELRNSDGFDSAVGVPVRLDVGGAHCVELPRAGKRMAARSPCGMWDASLVLDNNGRERRCLHPWS
jgi:hypothetical protein